MEYAAQEAARRLSYSPMLFMLFAIEIVWLRNIIIFACRYFTNYYFSIIYHDLGPGSSGHRREDTMDADQQQQQQVKSS